MTVVGVTMFFNLKPLQDSTEAVRPDDFYKTNCVATLSVNAPLVILCDADTRAWIEPLRASLSSAPSHYVEKPITEYDHYKINLPIVVRNRQKPHIRNFDTRNTPSYFLTTTFKLHAIQIASEIVPDATHYAWIDFGCQHIAWEAKERLQSIFDSPKPKIAMMYIHYRSKRELSDMMYMLARGGYCGMAGTVFTVEKAYVQLYYTRGLQVLYDQVSNDVGHADEQVFTYMYDRYPEMFTLYYGDYYSVVSNYVDPVRDYKAIQTYFIQNALRAGRQDLAKTAAVEVMEAYIKGVISIDGDNLAFLRGLL